MDEKDFWGEAAWLLWLPFVLAVWALVHPKSLNSLRKPRGRPLWGQAPSTPELIATETRAMGIFHGMLIVALLIAFGIYMIFS